MTVRKGYISLKWIARTYCIAHGTLLIVMQQPGWERSLRENWYLHMSGWVPLLVTWNYHNIVKWLYPTQHKVKKKKFKEIFLLTIRTLFVMLRGQQIWHQGTECGGLQAELEDLFVQILIMMLHCLQCLLNSQIPYFFLITHSFFQD